MTNINNLLTKIQNQAKDYQRGRTYFVRQLVNGKWLVAGEYLMEEEAQEAARNLGGKDRARIYDNLTQKQIEIKPCRCGRQDCMDCRVGYRG